MVARFFTQSFKIQAVEKALKRSEGTTLKEISEDLGIGHSTLDRWIVQARDRRFESVYDQTITSARAMTTEQRPQDRSLEEKLNMVIACASLDEAQVSEYCRQHGVYPHHIKQWKQDFTAGEPVNTQAKAPSDTHQFKSEIRALKKELNRKDKALAETAALLVLQKKVNAIWGNDEDDSQ